MLLGDIGIHNTPPYTYIHIKKYIQLALCNHKLYIYRFNPLLVENIVTHCIMMWLVMGCIYNGGPIRLYGNFLSPSDVVATVKSGSKASHRHVPLCFNCLQY